MSGLVRHVNELSAGLLAAKAGQLTLERAGRLLALTKHAYEIALTADEGRYPERDELRSAVLDLAAALSELNTATFARWTVAELAHEHHLLLYVLACEALLACCAASHLAQLSDSDAFRVASSAALLFDSGTRALTASVSAGQAKHSDMQLRQLTAAFGVLRFALDFERLPKAADAFAGSTGRPAVLLPWLRAVTAALQDSEDVGMEAACTYAHVVRVILSVSCYAKHAATVAADPQLQDALAGALLLRCLPRFASSVESVQAAGYSAKGLERVRSVTDLAAALAAPSIVDGLQRLCSSPNAGGSAVRHACRLALALPARLPDGGDGETFARAQRASYTLLVNLLSAAEAWAAAGARGTGSGDAAAGVGSSAGAASGSAGSSGGGGTTRNGPPQPHQVHLALQVAGLLPHATEVVRTLASLEGEACADPLGVVLASLAACTMSLQHLHLNPLGWRSLVNYAEAAEAALRVQPLLAEISGNQGQQAGQQGGQGAGGGTPGQEPDVGGLAGVLAMQLLEQLWLGVPEHPGVLGRGADSDAQQRRDAAQRLWRLHSAGCRLLHWLAADSRRQLAGLGPMTAASWHSMLSGLHRVYLRIFMIWWVQSEDGYIVDTCKGDLGHPEAVCAAHVCTMQTVAAAVEACDPSRGRSFPGVPPYQFAVAARVCASAVTATTLVCPGLLDAACLAPIMLALSVLPSAAQEGHDSGDVRAADHIAFEMLCAVTESEAHVPRLWAALVSTGLLSRGLKACAALLASCPEGEREALTAQMQALVPKCIAWVKMLTMEAGRIERATQASPQEPVPAGAAANQAAGRLPLPLSAGAVLAAELATAVRHLEAGLEPLLRAENVEEQISGLQQVADSAAPQLCALLQRWWAQPEQAAAVQRQLAQAASLRSCANLRCANVGLRGGPGAGEGENCRRCIACRTAWYCGMECSRVDWRSGHKHMCIEWAQAREAAQAGDGGSGHSPR